MSFALRVAVHFMRSAAILLLGLRTPVIASMATVVMVLDAVIAMNAILVTSKDMVPEAVPRTRPVRRAVLSVAKAQVPSATEPGGWHETVIPTEGVFGMEPGYHRGFLWGDDEKMCSPSADATLTARPVPKPPDGELNNLAAVNTIRTRPDLFKIVTPIRVDRLEELLRPHPNRPFVESILNGLREGFWPYADESVTTAPVEIPNHATVLQDPAILRKARDRELEMGRFSAPFPELLPAMRTAPLGLVPKKASGQFRMIVDHSAGGLHSLNSTIPHDRIAVRYDNVRDLGACLLAFRRENGDRIIFLWKSDISEAFRLIPVHPLWQIKQVVRIGNHFFVDRNLVMGSSASPCVWCAFASLIAWIARHHHGIDPMQHYVDDFFGFDLSPHRLDYGGQLYPRAQVRFLHLLDHLGIPHNPDKQVYGHWLEIIGIMVNPVTMEISLADEKRLALVARIRAFVGKENRLHDWVDWVRILGEINWGLNILPLARPALSAAYEKITSTPTHPVHRRSHIWTNRTVTREFTWLANQFEAHAGVSFIKSRRWALQEFEKEAFVDACPTGIGVYIPLGAGGREIGIYCPVPNEGDWRDNNHNEMMATVCALAHFANGHYPGLRRILIHTDSLDAVGCYASLRARGKLNTALLCAVDIIIRADFSPRIIHIPGVENSNADALSRGMLDQITQQHPNILLLRMSPPRWSLGEPGL